MERAPIGALSIVMPQPPLACFYSAPPAWNPAAVDSYALTRWTGLSRFLDDGRIELDSNTVERSIRPLALNRKNALFAGSDDGGDHWAVIASMIETCKLSGINPQTWLADTLTRLAAGHSATALDQLMPWNHAAAGT